MMVFSEQQNTEINESDVEDAQFADNIISDDEEDDVEIDWKTKRNHKKSSSALILFLSFVFKKKKHK